MSHYRVRLGFIIEISTTLEKDECLAHIGNSFTRPIEDDEFITVLQTMVDEESTIEEGENV